MDPFFAKSVGKFLLVDKLDQRVTSGGLVLPTDPDQLEGTVLAVGDEVTGIAPGDRVLFDKAYESKVDGRKVCRVLLEDVFAYFPRAREPMRAPSPVRESGNHPSYLELNIQPR